MLQEVAYLQRERGDVAVNAKYWESDTHAFIPAAFRAEKFIDKYRTFMYNITQLGKIDKE